MSYTAVCPDMMSVLMLSSTLALATLDLSFMNFFRFCAADSQGRGGEKHSVSAHSGGRRTVWGLRESRQKLGTPHTHTSHGRRHMRRHMRRGRGGQRGAEGAVMGAEWAEGAVVGAEWAE